MSNAPREIPASAGHRLMWMLERVGGQDGALNLAFALRVRGPVSDPALLAALWDLTDRHEALRTTFGGRGPELTQLIHPAGSRPDGVVEALPVPSGPLAEAVSAQTRHRFDLTSEWPARLRIFRSAPDERIVLVCVHHIAVDGASMRVLLEDLWSAYEVRCGRPASTPPPAWQQADVTEWQRRRLADGTLDAAIQHWRSSLGASQPAELPAILRSDPAAAAPGSGRSRTELPAELTGRLRQIAGQQRATIFAALLAGFCQYLASSSESDQVIVPVMFANRGHQDCARTVGFLANLLLLPMDLSGRPSFTELVRQARTVLLGALTHQEVPYHLVPVAAGGRRPPQLLLEYSSEPGDPPAPAGLTVTRFDEGGAVGTRYAAELHLLDQDDTISIECRYDRQQISARAAGLYVAGYLEVLTEAAGRATTHE